MKGSDGIRGTRKDFLDLKEKQVSLSRLLFSQWQQKCPEVGGSQDAVEPKGQ